MTNKKIISYAPKNLDSGKKIFRNRYYPIYPKFPFQMTVAGATETGKSNTLLDLFVYHPHSPIEYTIWIAPIASLKQPKIVDALKKIPNKFDVVEGLDFDEIHTLIDENKNKQIMLVFDDLVNNKNKQIMNDMFTGGRHLNCAVVEITQKIFSHDAMIRRENCGLYILTTFGDMRGIKMLFDRLYEKEESIKVFLAYKACMKGRGSSAFFFIDKKCLKDENEDNHIMEFRCNSLDNIVHVLD